jgi:hypothetical protein
LSKVTNNFNYQNYEVQYQNLRNFYSNTISVSLCTIVAHYSYFRSTGNGLRMSYN